MLTNAKSVHKIEAIQKRSLRFKVNDYESTYEDLLEKSGNRSMNLRRTRSLNIEIYKTINNLNPEFMKNLFKVCKTNRAQREKYKLNLEIPKSNQVFFGTKSLCIQGHMVWNALPFHIKSKENLQASSFETDQNVVAIFVLILISNSLIIYQFGLLFVCIRVFCLWFVFGRNSVILTRNSSLLNSGKRHF